MTETQAHRWAADFRTLHGLDQYIVIHNQESEEPHFTLDPVICACDATLPPAFKWVRIGNTAVAPCRNSRMVDTCHLNLDSEQKDVLLEGARFYLGDITGLRQLTSKPPAIVINVTNPEAISSIGKMAIVLEKRLINNGEIRDITQLAGMEDLVELRDNIPWEISQSIKAMLQLLAENREEKWLFDSDNQFRLLEQIQLHETEPFTEGISALSKPTGKVLSWGMLEPKKSLKIGLYGAGGLGRALLTPLRDESEWSFVFFDSNPDKWGTSIDGVRVYSREKMAEFGLDCVLITTTMDDGSVGFWIEKNVAGLTALYFNAPKAPKFSPECNVPAAFLGTEEVREPELSLSDNPSINLHRQVGDPQETHIVTALWGKTYMQWLADLALPSLLASDNIPKWDLNPICIEIYAPENEMEILEQAPVWPLLQQACRVHHYHLEPPGEKDDKYRYVSLFHEHAMKRAIERQASLIYCSPDSFYNNGALDVIQIHARQGKELIVIPGWQVNHNIDRDPILTGHDGILNVSSQTCRRLVDEYMHLWVKTCFLESPVFTHWPSHIYTRPEPDVIEARCFHLHPLYIKRPIHATMSRCPLPNYDGTYLQQYTHLIDEYKIKVIQDASIMGMSLTPPLGPEWTGKPMTLEERILCLTRFVSKHTSPLNHWFFEHSIRI